MAYDFANTILRSLQTQDELNMHKQQMGLEEARFEQQMGQQNRQFGLEQDRLNATLQQNQEMNKFRQFNASETFRKNFLSQYETKNEIPSTLTKQMPSTPDMIVSPEFGSQFNLPAGEYYSKNRLTNIKTAASIQHGQTMETQGATRNKIAQQNANANTTRANIEAAKQAGGAASLKGEDATLVGNLQDDYTHSQSPGIDPVDKANTDASLEQNIQKLVGRNELGTVEKAIRNDIQNGKTFDESISGIQEYLKSTKQPLLNPYKINVLQNVFHYKPAQITAQKTY